MDLRVQRTRRNIRDAFIELRSRKPIEKMTVKELAEAAFINKATFYQHYEDLYALSESMEDELIDNIIGSIPHPDTLLEDPEQATLEIFGAFSSQTRLLEILFSGSRRSVLIGKLESRIRELMLRKYPHYENDPEKEVLITFLIQGSFHAYLKHSGSDQADSSRTVRLIAALVKQLQPFPDQAPPAASRSCG
ncbi:MAG TPA: TetR/AcrR family transcriptional regulator [Candidatus Eisenbergiella intestinipullorum]|nr:TetR/AcrR family transcriptional regulator [Candidatus Eisenbergiella intestinipullorum]